MSCRDRPNVWNASTAYIGMGLQTADAAKQNCKARGADYFYGIGGLFKGSISGVENCFEPCPDASCNGYDIDGNQTYTCNARPLLTAVDIYYQVLQDATKSCMDKSEAYKRAVEEGGGDPSRIGFTADCPNPYTPAVPPNTDPTADGVFDPASSNGDPTKPLDVPPFDPTVPYIPPPPASYRDYDGIASDTSPPNPDLPTSRITLTDAEIDMFPKVNDYGTMREDTFAQLCRVNPTYVDVNTEHLNDCEKYIKDFTWCCIPTQAEFDKLNDDLQCVLATEYTTLYDKPERIKEMRNFAPSITITRDAPPVDAPIYTNTPEERKRQECTGKKNVDGVDCVYSGGCRGNCVCPPPKCTHVDMGHDIEGKDVSYDDCGDGDTRPSAPPALPDWSPPDTMTIVLIAGGLMVVGIGGYYAYKFASPVGRASALAGGNFGTSLSSLGMGSNFGTSLSSLSMGGFKLVPA